MCFLEPGLASHCVFHLYRKDFSPGSTDQAAFTRLSKVRDAYGGPSIFIDYSNGYVFISIRKADGEVIKKKNEMLVTNSTDIYK